MLPPLVTNGLNPRACKLLPYLMYQADHQTGRVSRFRQERAATALGMSAKTLGLALRDLEQARCVRVEGHSGEPLRVTLTDPMELTPVKMTEGSVDSTDPRSRSHPLQISPQTPLAGGAEETPRSPCLSTAIRPYSRSHIYHPMHGHDAAARRPQA